MAEILNVEIAQRLREVAALLQEQGAIPSVCRPIAMPPTRCSGSTGLRPRL
jgi:hypothetical protein